MSRKLEQTVYYVEGLVKKGVMTEADTAEIYGEIDSVISKKLSKAKGISETVDIYKEYKKDKENLK